MREPHPSRRTSAGRAVAVISFAVLMTVATIGCDDKAVFEQAAIMTGGNPYRGRAAIRTYGCGSCHTIPGVAGADALVGPPLTHIASRSYVGGVIQNTPENLVHWILDPPSIDSKTAMPNLKLSETDARDIAGYLYTLH